MYGYIIYDFTYITSDNALTVKPLYAYCLLPIRRINSVNLSIS